MNGEVKIYRENYTCLPKRFVNKIDADIAYLLKTDIPGLKKVFLFGSCARGEVRSSSDVDMLILTEKKFADRVLAAAIRCTLDEEICGVSTDVVYMNEDSVKEDTAFHRVVNRDKKLVLEVIG